MISDLISISAVVLVSITAIFILITSDWRYSIIALILQYVGVFVLVNVSWPMEMSAAKMVAGWMSGAILGIAMASTTRVWREEEKSIKLGPVFRILAAIITIVTIYSLVVHSDTWLSNINTQIRWGSLILIGLGILQLSLTSHPLRIIIGLLTALSGFEVIYAAIEASTLVTGLLAAVNLGLALVGAYLIVTPAMESTP